MFDPLVYENLKPVLTRMGNGLLSEVEKLKNTVRNLNIVGGGGGTLDFSYETLPMSDRYLIFHDIPGIETQYVNVSIYKTIYLKITYERQPKYKIGSQYIYIEPGHDFYSTSIRYGKGETLIKLPIDADTDKMTHNMNRGVLEIDIPKKQYI